MALANLSFDRTYEELKLWPPAPSSFQPTRFDRTYEELKPPQ